MPGYDAGDIAMLYHHQGYGKAGLNKRLLESEKGRAFRPLLSPGCMTARLFGHDSHRSSFHPAANKELGRVLCHLFLCHQLAAPFPLAWPQCLLLQTAC